MTPNIIQHSSCANILLFSFAVNLTLDSSQKFIKKTKNCDRTKNESIQKNLPTTLNDM